MQRNYQNAPMGRGPIVGVSDVLDRAPTASMAASNESLATEAPDECIS